MFVAVSDMNEDLRIQYECDAQRIDLTFVSHCSHLHCQPSMPLKCAPLSSSSLSPLSDMSYSRSQWLFFFPF